MLFDHYTCFLVFVLYPQKKDNYSVPFLFFSFLIKEKKKLIKARKKELVFIIMTICGINGTCVQNSLFYVLVTLVYVIV
jgi:hypothetical protein